MPMPRSRTTTDPRFKRPYPARRQRAADRRAASRSVSKLFLRVAAVVAVLLVATLVILFQHEGQGEPLMSSAPVPLGQ